MWLAVLCLLLQQAAVQAGPLLVAYAIDSAVPAFRTDDHGPLIAVAVGYLLAASCSSLFQFAFVQVSARVNQNVLLDLRGRIFRHAQALSVDFHDRYTSGRLISRATTDVESLRELLAEGLQELINIILASVYITAMLLWLDVGIGAVAALSFLPLAVLIQLYRRRAARVYAERSSAIARVIVKFAETMNGIRPVRAFRRERANDADFAGLNHRHERVNGDALLEMARYVVGSRLLANTAVAGMVLWGAYRVADGTLELGVLAAAVLFIRRLYDPIDRLAMFLNSYESAAASLRKIAGLLHQTPTVPEPSSPRGLPELMRRPSRPRGRLRPGLVRLPHRRRGAPPLRPHAARGTDGRRGRLHGRREVDAGQAPGPLLRPLGGPGPARRRGPARPGHGRAAAGRGDGDAGGVPVLRHGRREHRDRPTSRRAARRSSARRRRSARTTSSRRSRTATTRMCANAGVEFRPGSDSWSRSHARCSPTPRS